MAKLTKWVYNAVFGSSERLTTRRVSHRFPLRSKVALAWKGAEGTIEVVAAGVDMSESGICVKSRAEIPPNTDVLIVIPSLRLVGRGVTRHRTPHGFTHRIGISFQGSLCQSYAGLRVEFHRAA
jgi:hypothetical protein